MRTTRYSEPSDAEFDRAMEHKLVAEGEDEEEDQDDEDGDEVCDADGGKGTTMTEKTTSTDEVGSASCAAFLEDWAVCDDMGEPKGQCSHCGYASDQ